MESLTLVDVDALADVDALVESETLVLVDSLNDVLSLFESLSLVDVDALCRTCVDNVYFEHDVLALSLADSDALSDVDVLADPERLVLVEPLNDVTLAR